MKLLTNIILTSQDIITKSYVLEYKPAENDIHSDTYRYKGSCDNENIAGNISVIMNQDESHIVKSVNEWYFEDTTVGGETQTIPNAHLTMYFPQYGIEVNNPKARYILTASTFIGGHLIELGCFTFKRTDALACTPVKFGGMSEYYESIDFVLPDLYTIISENYFNINGARMDFNNDFNNDYTIYQENFDTKEISLNLSLYIVDFVDDKYIKSDSCNSGQNNIIIYDPKDLQLKAGIELNDRNDDYNICLNLDFNKKSSDDNINDYILNNYGIINPIGLYRTVIMDENDIYKAFVKIGLEDELKIPMNEGPSVQSLGSFFNWDNWKPGLYIQSSISIIDGDTWTEEDVDDGEYEPAFVLFSNKLILTQDLFAKLITPSEFESRKVEISAIDMNNINVTAINKIEQNIKTVNINNADTKSHLVQPVFYQTRNLKSVAIHPAVTENISLQLDQYKSKVKSFVLQVEGINFKETARTSAGVIFKVVGKSLPKAADEGTLYILNQDLELVTTGKYIYIY